MDRGREGDKRIGVAAKLSSQLDRIIQTFESSISAQDPTSITACVAKLKDLPGLERESELFYKATKLMEKRANRITFVALEEPELQLGWIKMSSSLSSNDSSLSSNDFSSDDDDHITKNKVLMFVVANVTNYFMKYVVKNPCIDSSIAGHRWVSEILNGHPIRCYQMFRMKKLVFLELCDILETKYNLKKTRNVSIYEQVDLFLYMLSQPGSIRNCEERFQHLGETISRHFHNVLEVVCMFAKDIIKPVDPSFRDTPDEILKDARYRLYFRDCIGAIDGWEGSAHDTKIFMEALRNPALHFPHPPQGKYYLVDSGYPTFMGFLGPYKKTRYHLPQFRIGPRIRRRVEVFNYYHSSLRSTIERAFGLCKARWKILGNMPPFALMTQNQIIDACMAIHNFIQRNDKSGGEFDSLDEDNEDIDSDEDESEVGPSTTTWEEPDAQSTLQMERFRESLKNMFPTRI
ncbi:hypothetical protein D0Y65_030527 [Glycine soja]|uniref:Uncharacterized protein n=1 Tax=Glycine soja TaxID=3848 RepID=A0A445I463_GLYSO|nr:hypothetical protein D0Y65_030527 [Glycine soja]